MQRPGLVARLALVVEQLLTLAERESAILIADPEENLVALVRVHYIAWLDFDDEQMVGLAVFVLALEDSLTYSHRRLAEVDAGPHLRVPPSGRLSIPSTFPAADAHDDDAPVGVSKADQAVS